MNAPEQPSFSVDDLVGLSRGIGSDPEMVLAGGGNISLKLGKNILIKASGHSLAGIGPEGFVELDRQALRAILQEDLSPDPTERERQFKDLILAARGRSDLGQRPSVESLLHELIPSPFVLHLHPTLVNMITCCEQGEEHCRSLFGEHVLWVSYVNPGYVLARQFLKQIEAYQGHTGRDCPPAIFLQSHGLIVGGQSPEDIRQKTSWIMDTIRRRLAQTSAQEVFGSGQCLAEREARSLRCRLASALSDLLAEGERLKIVTFSDAEEIMALCGGDQGREAAATGPLTPDQIVYCTCFPLWLEPAENENDQALAARLAAAIAEHRKTTGFPPKVVLVKGLGLLAVGDDDAQAGIVRDVYVDAVKVMAGARRLGGIRYLSPDEREFIEHWEVENYRRQVSAGVTLNGRAFGK